MPARTLVAIARGNDRLRRRRPRFEGARGAKACCRVAWRTGADPLGTSCSAYGTASSCGDAYLAQKSSFGALCCAVPSCNCARYATERCTGTGPAALLQGPVTDDIDVTPQGVAGPIATHGCLARARKLDRIRDGQSTAMLRAKPWRSLFAGLHGCLTS